MTDEERFDRAVEISCAAHREDPQGAALAYHTAVAQWVDRLQPDAAVTLRLAAWCQHLRRWTLPRDDFAAGRAGYRRWRSTLARQHAEDAGEILRGVGYGPDVVERVGQLLVKKGLGRDPQVQVLEDAVCIVFLAQQLEPFVAAHPRDKVVGVLRKTWAKMSEAGRTAAGEVASGLGPTAQALVAEATREGAARSPIL